MSRGIRSSLMVVALILGVLILAVEAYYAGRFYNDSHHTPAPRQAAVAETSSPAGPRATPPSDYSFVHRADPGNISANSTYLDSPALNGNRDAIIFVTQSWNPGGGNGTYNDHPVGVWYDPGRNKWAIFNQDRAAMPKGAAFNVAVSAGK